MEQLWYTWSINGPKSGFQIRAASRGLGEDDERTTKLLPLVRYRLPEGTRDVRLQDAPVSLSLTETRYGHILIRKVYKLDDNDRPGAFFSHLVLLNDLSKPFTMREAIDLWASSFWRESENASDPRILPSIKTPEELTPAKASPFEQFDINKRPALETLFVSVLLAFFTHENSTHENRRRFYILAPSPVVTAMIWGLAHCLPRTLRWWNEITFTTYDYDVSKASEFIIGTCRFPTSSSQDLPEDCYSGENMAIAIHPETFQIRRASLPQPGENPLYLQFASYAAGCLVKCSIKELSDLVDIAEQQATGSLYDFLKLYEQEIIGKLLSLEELLVALKNKTANESQLKKPKNLKAFVDAIINVSGYWERGARVALLAFRQRAENDPGAAEIRLSLTQEVVTALTRVMQSNNPKVLFYLVQSLVELAPARKNGSMWQRLLHYFSPAVIPFAPVATSILFPWHTRELLLSQWVQLIQPYEETDMHVWLKAAWEDLGKLLQLVPQSWDQLVVSFRLTEGAPISQDAITSVGNVVRQYGNDLFKPALLKLIQGSSHEQVEAAVNFINQSLLYTYDMRLQFLYEMLLADRNGATTQRLNATVSNSLQKDDLFRFVETYIPQLAKQRLLPPALEFIKSSINRYFDFHQPDDLVNRLPNITGLITDLIPLVANKGESDDILTILTKNVVYALLKIVQMQDDDALYRLLRAFQLLAPDSTTSASANAWWGILEKLPVPGHSFPWQARALLLLQWAKIAQISARHVSAWLDVQWRELEHLLMLPVPEEWRLVAIEKRIEDDAPLSITAGAVIEKDANKRFDQTLERYVKNGTNEQVAAAVRFVKKLLKQKYPRRLPLLLTLLIADKSGDATLQLCGVNLGDDLFEFVENHLQSLFDYARRTYTADALRGYFDQYFAELTPGDLISYQPTRNLLHDLRRILAFDLKNDALRVRIQCWQEIAKFLEPGKDVASRDEVVAFTKALAAGALSLKTRQQLSETLAPVLALHDFENEPLELVRIINLMETALLDSTSLRLLARMAISAGRRFGASQRKIFPYIMLVLDEAHRLAEPEKKLFLENSLNHLLIHINSRDEQIFREIARRVEDLPTEDIAEWNEYLSESRFTQTEAVTFPSMPWRFYLHFSYWRRWRLYRNLRKAIRRRTATEIARIARLLPENDKNLTDDENDIVLSAKDFIDACKEDNDMAIVHTYQSIWENYRGRLFFSSHELERIEKAEQRQMARGRAE